MLAAVLLALAAFSVPGWGFSTDEGAPVAQALILQEHGQWEEPRSANADIDPRGIARPYFNAAVGDDGVAPFVKHPLYVLPVRALLPFGDGAVAVGMQLLSLMGAVAAAAAAGRLARVIDTSLATPALWLAGAASPLFFDAHLLMAHTLAAAAVGWIAVWIVTPARRKAAWTVAASALAGALAVGLRSEGLLALAGVLLAAALSCVGRHPRLVAGAALAGGVVARVLEAVFVRSVLGSTGRVSGAPARSGDVIGGRLDGLATTVLAPGYGESAEQVLLSVMLVLVVVVAVALRLGRPWVAVTCAVAAATAAAARVVSAPAGAVPGLLVAAPLLTAGWILVEPLRMRGPRAFLAVASALAAAAVLATQYERGGGIEWGWRYVAVVLPLAVPLAADGLSKTRRSLSAPQSRLVATSAAIIAVAMAVLAMSALASPRARARSLSELIREAAPRERGSVVVSLQPHIPRILWADLDRHRWLTPSEDELDELLGAPGMPAEVVLVTPHPEADVPGWQSDVGDRSVGGLSVVVLRREP